MRSLPHPAAFARVSHIAGQRSVHQAFQWLHLHEQQIMRWQAEMVAIPAPPFGERARAGWVVERFKELGLEDVHLDAVGNASGVYPRFKRPNDMYEAEPTGCILLSAHIDTVFPVTTPINPTIDGQRLTAPGACDNGAGVVALLALAAALRHAGIESPHDILFAGNVGEEGEGDLRGIRHIYQQAREAGVTPIRNAERRPLDIEAHIVLDGAGHELVVTSAVGSRRYQVTIEGPGGHSWSDAGRPNPIVAMSQGITRMSQSQSPNSAICTAVDSGAEPPETGRSTRWNVGTIEGGTSVNSIPQSVSARFDIRSTDPAELTRLEVKLYRAFEDAVLAASAGSTIKRAKLSDGNLCLAIKKIGDRPTGQLPQTANILESLHAVDRHLGIRTDERVASTDANIPLSLGIEAVSIGAGGEGGATHTTNEWYDARNRTLGLRRILLLLLTLSNSYRPQLAISAD
ncbi:MAG TPA: M20/M25/M40 family metallo-hydrolase [Acidisarcina sp.]